MRQRLNDHNQLYYHSHLVWSNLVDYDQCKLVSDIRVTYVPSALPSEIPFVSSTGSIPSDTRTWLCPPHDCCLHTTFGKVWTMDDHPISSWRFVSKISMLPTFQVTVSVFHVNECPLSLSFSDLILSLSLCLSLSVSLSFSVSVSLSLFFFSVCQCLFPLSLSTCLLGLDRRWRSTSLMTLLRTYR
jgi:hypothetical protein